MTRKDRKQKYMHVDKDMLAHQMHVRSGLTKKDCLIAIDAYNSVVKDDVAKNRLVYLYGFGRFGFHTWPSRRVKDLVTHRMKMLHQVKTPTFKPSTVFRAELKR